MAYLVRYLDMRLSTSHSARAQPDMLCVQVKKAAAPAKTQVGASHNLQACDHAAPRAGWVAQLRSASPKLCSLTVPAEASHSTVCTLTVLCTA